MLLRYSPYTLLLKHTFVLASGSRTTTPVVLVEVDAEGTVGYGEASLPPYLGETPETVGKFLTMVDLEAIDSMAVLEQVLSDVDALAVGNHAAKAAVDIALHDWLGKKLGRAWHQIWGVDPDRMPDTTYTIGMGDREFVHARVLEAREFRVLKVKLGGNRDCEIVAAVREMTNVPLRVDVNQGWCDRGEALDMIEWLAGRGVELVEQPLPKESIDDTVWLRERSPLPIVADESVQRLHDVRRLQGVFDGINIKLMKCTGMHEAHEMIGLAKDLGMKTMLGCMTETSCAISAAAQLAPLVDWADLDGALLISNDPFEGATVRGGRMVMPKGPGIGAKPRR